MLTDIWREYSVTCSLMGDNWKCAMTGGWHLNLLTCGVLLPRGVAAWTVEIVHLRMWHLGIFIWKFDIWECDIWKYSFENVMFENVHLRRIAAAGRGCAGAGGCDWYIRILKNVSLKTILCSLFGTLFGEFSPEGVGRVLVLTLYAVNLIQGGENP